MPKHTRYAARANPHKATLKEADEKHTRGEVLSAEFIEKCRSAVEFFEDQAGGREMGQYKNLRTEYKLGFIVKKLDP